MRYTLLMGVMVAGVVLHVFWPGGPSFAMVGVLSYVIGKHYGKKDHELHLQQVS